MNQGAVNFAGMAENDFRLFELKKKLRSFPRRLQEARKQLVAEEALSLEDIVDDTLSSEPMDIVQIAPGGDAKEAEELVSLKDGESGAGEAPAAEEEPEVGVPLPGGSPLEAVRELVATLCPGDLVLIEEIPERLPAGAAEAGCRRQFQAQRQAGPETRKRLAGAAGK